MFADPQTVTYNAVAKSLACISRSSESSVYRFNDSATNSIYTLTLSHSFKTRNRAVARIQRESITTDPLSSSTNIDVSMTATMTIDFPNAGLTPVDAQMLGNCLTGFLSSANVLKLANGET